MNNRVESVVINFNPVNENKCTLQVKSRMFNITFIFIHAPTEGYDRLEDVCSKAARHDIKILLGDLNAKIEKEEAFGKTIGKASVHSVKIALSKDYGLRIIDFAINKKNGSKEYSVPTGH